MKLHVRLFDGRQENRIKLRDQGAVLPVRFKDVQVMSKVDGEPYEGEYEVNPSFELQKLLTAHKYLSDDVRVNAIEVSTVSNPSGGNTVYIGGII